MKVYFMQTATLILKTTTTIINVTRFNFSGCVKWKTLKWKTFFFFFWQFEHCIPVIIPFKGIAFSWIKMEKTFVFLQIQSTIKNLWSLLSFCRQNFVDTNHHTHHCTSIFVRTFTDVIYEPASYPFLPITTNPLKLTLTLARTRT